MPVSGLKDMLTGWGVEGPAGDNSCMTTSPCSRVPTLDPWWSSGVDVLPEQKYAEHGIHPRLFHEALGKEAIGFWCLNSWLAEPEPPWFNDRSGSVMGELESLPTPPIAHSEPVLPTCPLAPGVWEECFYWSAAPDASSWVLGFWSRLSGPHGGFVCSGPPRERRRFPLGVCWKMRVLEGGIRGRPPSPRAQVGCPACRGVILEEGLEQNPVDGPLPLWLGHSDTTPVSAGGQVARSWTLREQSAVPPPPLGTGEWASPSWS